MVEYGLIDYGGEHWLITISSKNNGTCRIKYYGRSDYQHNVDLNVIKPLNQENIKKHWSKRLNTHKKFLLKLGFDVADLPSFPPKKRRRSIDEQTRRKRNKRTITYPFPTQVRDKDEIVLEQFSDAWEVLKQNYEADIGVMADVVIHPFFTFWKLQEKYKIDREDANEIYVPANKLRLPSQTGVGIIQEGVLLYFHLDFTKASLWPSVVVVDLLTPMKTLGRNVTLDLNESSIKLMIKNMPRGFLTMKHCDCLYSLKTWLSKETEERSNRVIEQFKWLWSKCNPEAEGTLPQNEEASADETESESIIEVKSEEKESDGNEVHIFRSHQKSFAKGDLVYHIKEKRYGLAVPVAEFPMHLSVKYLDQQDPQINIGPVFEFTNANIEQHHEQEDIELQRIQVKADTISRRDKRSAEKVTRLLKIKAALIAEQEAELTALEKEQKEARRKLSVEIEEATRCNKKAKDDAEKNKNEFITTQERKDKKINNYRRLRDELLS